MMSAPSSTSPSAEPKIEVHVPAAEADKSSRRVNWKKAMELSMLDLFEQIDQEAYQRELKDWSECEAIFGF